MNGITDMDMSTSLVVMRSAYSFIITILAKAFGKGIGFAIGLILLPFIFQLLLGFGSAEYEGAASIFD